MTDDATADVAAKSDEEVAVEALHYLKTTGWVRSRRGRLPVDRKGRPLPWYTYATIEFLSRRVTPEMRVFEFGSGNSTLWWAARTAHVTSVEHNREWAALMGPKLPDNVSYQHTRLEPDGAYSHTAETEGGPFDVVVIDGRDRVNCARHSLSAISDDGIIVWDNSDREKYQPGFDYLAENGFRRLEFWGHGPINAAPWETSVFYRPGSNALNI